MVNITSSLNSVRKVVAVIQDEEVPDSVSYRISQALETITWVLEDVEADLIDVDNRLRDLDYRTQSLG